MIAAPTTVQCGTLTSYGCWFMTRGWTDPTNLQFKCWRPGHVPYLLHHVGHPPDAAVVDLFPPCVLPLRWTDQWNMVHQEETITNHTSTMTINHHDPTIVGSMTNYDYVAINSHESLFSTTINPLLAHYWPIIHIMTMIIHPNNPFYVWPLSSDCYSWLLTMLIHIINIMSYSNSNTPWFTRKSPSFITNEPSINHYLPLFAITWPLLTIN